MMLSPNLFSLILPLLYELRVNKRTFSQIFHKRIVEKAEGSRAVRTGGSGVCGQQGAGWGAAACAGNRAPDGVRQRAWAAGHRMGGAPKPHYGTARGEERGSTKNTPPGGKKEAPRAVPTGIFPPGVHMVS